MYIVFLQLNKIIIIIIIILRQIVQTVDQQAVNNPCLQENW